MELCKEEVYLCGFYTLWNLHSVDMCIHFEWYGRLIVSDISAGNHGSWAHDPNTCKIRNAFVKNNHHISSQFWLLHNSSAGVAWWNVDCLDNWNWNYNKKKLRNVSTMNQKLFVKLVPHCSYVYDKRLWRGTNRKRNAWWNVCYLWYVRRINLGMRYTRHVNLEIICLSYSH